MDKEPNEVRAVRVFRRQLLPACRSLKTRPLAVEKTLQQVNPTLLSLLPGVSFELYYKHASGAPSLVLTGHYDRAAATRAWRLHTLLSKYEQSLVELYRPPMPTEAIQFFRGMNLDRIQAQVYHSRRNPGRYQVVIILPEASCAEREAHARQLVNLLLGERLTVHYLDDVITQAGPAPTHASALSLLHDTLWQYIEAQQTGE